VDARGRLHLASWCAAPPAHPGIFDLDGNPVAPETTAALPLYLGQGTYTSVALDSSLYRCQWHRVVLGGSIPAGASVEVQTMTSEVELDAGELAALPLETWQTRTVATGTGDGDWDCLVRSGPGRFLWLRLLFKGDGFVTPVLERIVVEFPRITSRRYLPAVFSAEPVSADFTDRFLSIFDTTLRGIERTLDTEARFFDPRSAPVTRRRADDVDFLTWIASWIGITLDRHWPEARRRRYVEEAAALYAVRGTPEGLRRALLLYLGLDSDAPRCADPAPKQRCVPRPPNCDPPAPPPPPWEAPRLVLEHFKLRRWLFVGAGRLGSDAELWGKRIVNRSQLDANARLGESRLISTPDPVRDPFLVYAHRFTVFVPACVGAGDASRKGLESLLRAEAPAHTAWDIRYVEPRFRVGVQAVIGYDSVIARTPVGVRLGDAMLRQGTVLGPAPHARGGPSVVVGRQARIGETTRLD
jgi:phage tail-like protein